MPVLNLLWIREPAYVLRGKILPEPPPGLEAGVWIFTGSDRVEGYEEATREVLEYFAVPRSRAEAGVAVSRWEAELADVDELVDQGVLLRFNPGDVASQLAGLSIWLTTTRTEHQPSENSVAFAVGSDGMVLISPEGAAVFSKPEESETLAAGVARVAGALTVSDDHVWRRVGVDMVWILSAGVGFITSPFELEGDPDRQGSGLSMHAGEPGTAESLGKVANSDVAAAGVSQ